MGRIFSVILLVTSTILLLGKAYIISDKIYEVETVYKNGDYYLNALQLKPLGLDYTLNLKDGIFYLFYNYNIITIKSSGLVEKDFLETIDENGGFFYGSKVYIKIDALHKATGISWRKLPNGSFVHVIKPIKVVSFEVSDKKIVVYFSAPIISDMVSLETYAYTLKITVIPVESGAPIPKSLEGGYFSGALVIKKRYDPKFSPRYYVDGNKLVVVMGIVEKDFFGEYKVYDGLVWRRVKEKFKGTTYIVNYLDIDLNSVKLVPELPQNGIGSLETVESMVKRTGALAGINANYFDPRTGMIIGLVVKNGVPLSNPYGGRPIFVITDDNEAYINRMYIEIYLEVGKTLFYVKALNTISKGEVSVYTPEFGKEVSYDKDKIYFVVKNGFVYKVGYEWPLKSKDEFLVGISKKYGEYLEDLKKGTPARLFLSTSYDVGIITAVEGGPLLIYDGNSMVNDGEEFRYGGGIPYAKAPRTVIALKDRKRLSIIVIEQTSEHPGMNFKELTEFLMKKGYSDAMCLDGGSSTSLVISGTIVNFTKTGRKPYVAVGLLVFPNE